MPEIYNNNSLCLIINTGSIELPKTTENHLKIKFIWELCPPSICFFSRLCLYISIFSRMDRKKKIMKSSYTDFDSLKCIVSTENQKQ